MDRFFERICYAQAFLGPAVGPCWDWAWAVRVLGWPDACIVTE